MGNRKRIIPGLILTLVYTFFFGSTNFFYHSHQIANIKIVHSHPWSGSGHSHNNGQITLIASLESATYENSDSEEIPVPIPAFTLKIDTEHQIDALPSVSLFNFSLRAPPACC